MGRELDDYIQKLKSACQRGEMFEEDTQAQRFKDFHDANQKAELPPDQKRLRTQMIVEAGQDLADLMNIKLIPHEVGLQLGTYVSVAPARPHMMMVVVMMLE